MTKSGKSQFVRIILIGCFIFSNSLANGQCPTFSVSVPPTLCINERFDIVNTTPGASYLWDFCTGDLKTTPSASSLGVIPGVNFIADVRVVQDGNSWYGFVVDRSVRNLIRFDFGSDPGNPIQATTNLGNPGGLIATASGLDLMYDGAVWYGVLINDESQMVLFEFGNSLVNAPTSRIIYTGIIGPFANIALARSGNAFFAVVSEFNSNAIRVFNFSNGLNNPSVGETSFDLGGGFKPIDIQIIEQCGSWYGFAVGYGNKSVARLDYGTDLTQAPTMTMLSGSLPLPPSFPPFRMRTVQEGDEFFCFISNENGGLARLDLGTSLTNNSPSLVTLGNFGVLSNSWALDVISFNGVWNAFMPNGNTGVFNKLAFANNCTINPGYSNQKQPTGVFSSSAGVKKLVLTVQAVNGSTAAMTFSTTVSSNVAPSLVIDNVGQCVNQPVLFSENITPTAPIVSHSWQFGDTGSFSGPNPSHTYSGTGTFDASVLITDNNGCTAKANKSVPIYNQPVAQFNLPAASPICTSQNYIFTNTSTFDPGSNPSWEWSLNGIVVSSQQNLTSSLSAPISQDIRLRALIPGCLGEITKTIPTVIQGPVVNFTAADNCQGNTVAFANTTTGADAGYLWNFGDGATSGAATPTHVYNSPATFQTTLTASNSAGCQNFQTKPIKIYSLPQPDFSVGLPPFSCSNSPTQFQNNTPPLTDSNIIAWHWQFGDAAAGSSLQAAPSYTYTASGNFNVMLGATSSAGCVWSTTKSIAIAAGPAADFTVGPSCLNLSTKFTDQSSGAVQSRLWQINSSSFTVPNPTYTFTSTGNFITTLSVTSANSCSSVKTKTVTVPVPPVQNFTATNPCAGKNTMFLDVTSTSDPVATWNWNFAGNSGTGNPAQYNFAAEGTYNVKMTTTHTSGCVYTLSKNVLINPSPIAGFTATPDRGAAPLTVQFVNTSQQSTSYLWRFYDKVTATSTVASPAYTFTSLGNFFAELTATNGLGCSDALSVPIKVLVPVVDIVMQDFSLVNDPSTGKIKCLVTILNNSNIPIQSAEVSLFLADKAVVNETLVINLNPGQSVAKTLSFTLVPDQYSFLCAEINSEKDVQADNNRRCINGETQDYFFGPYPNPSSGAVSVDWITSKPGTAHIMVHDNMGRKMFEWSTTSHSGLNQALLDLSFLSAGLHYLTIDTSISKKTMRILRQ